jgi:hypothetical protein
MTHIFPYIDAIVHRLLITGVFMFILVRSILYAAYLPQFLLCNLIIMNNCCKETLISPY